MTLDDKTIAVEQKKEEEKERRGSDSDSDSGKTPDELCSASDHFTKFNPLAYLESFYKTAGEDLAMKVVLFFLPGLLYRLPKEIRTMLDLGAGPTVYLPIAVRDRVANIYTSDYAPANREALVSFINKTTTFDWGKICTWIGNIEATPETPEQMQEKARKKMRAVLDVNVHESPVVRGLTWKADDDIPVPEQFQVVSTVFCLEYSGETLQEYLRAVKGACSLVEPGGYLVQGGVLDADCYNFNGKKFRSHRLTREHIHTGLKEAGMCTDPKSPDFKYIERDDVVILVSRKPPLIETPEETPEETQ